MSTFFLSAKTKPSNLPPPSTPNTASPFFPSLSVPSFVTSPSSASAALSPSSKAYLSVEKTPHLGSPFSRHSPKSKQQRADQIPAGQKTIEAVLGLGDHGREEKEQQQQQTPTRLWAQQQAQQYSSQYAATKQFSPTKNQPQRQGLNQSRSTESLRHQHQANYNKHLARSISTSFLASGDVIAGAYPYSSPPNRSTYAEAAPSNASAKLATAAERWQTVEDLLEHSHQVIQAGGKVLQQPSETTTNDAEYDPNKFDTFSTSQTDMPLLPSKAPSSQQSVNARGQFIYGSPATWAPPSATSPFTSKAPPPMPPPALTTWTGTTSHATTGLLVATHGRAQETQQVMKKIRKKLTELEKKERIVHVNPSVLYAAGMVDETVIVTEPDPNSPSRTRPRHILQSQSATEKLWQQHQHMMAKARRTLPKELQHRTKERVIEAVQSLKPRVLLDVLSPQAHILSVSLNELISQLHKESHEKSALLSHLTSHQRLVLDTLFQFVAVSCATLDGEDGGGQLDEGETESMRLLKETIQASSLDDPNSSSLAALMAIPFKPDGQPRQVLQQSSSTQPSQSQSQSQSPSRHQRSSSQQLSERERARQDGASSTHATGGRSQQPSRGPSRRGEAYESDIDEEEGEDEDEDDEVVDENEGEENYYSFTHHSRTSSAAPSVRPSSSHLNNLLESDTTNPNTESNTTNNGGTNGPPYDLLTSQNLPPESLSFGSQHIWELERWRQNLLARRQKEIKHEELFLESLGLISELSQIKQRELMLIGAERFQEEHRESYEKVHGKYEKERLQVQELLDHLKLELDPTYAGRYVRHHQKMIEIEQVEREAEEAEAAAAAAKQQQSSSDLPAVSTTDPATLSLHLSLLRQAVPHHSTHKSGAASAKPGGAVHRLPHNIWLATSTPEKLDVLASEEDDAASKTIQTRSLSEVEATNLRNMREKRIHAILKLENVLVETHEAYGQLLDQFRSLTAQHAGLQDWSQSQQKLIDDQNRIHAEVVRGMEAKFDLETQRHRQTELTLIATQASLVASELKTEQLRTELDELRVLADQTKANYTRYVTNRVSTIDAVEQTEEQLTGLMSGGWNSEGIVTTVSTIATSPLAAEMFGPDGQPLPLNVSEEELAAMTAAGLLHAPTQAVQLNLPPSSAGASKSSKRKSMKQAPSSAASANPANSVKGTNKTPVPAAAASSVVTSTTSTPGLSRLSSANANGAGSTTSQERIVE